MAQGHWHRRLCVSSRTTVSRPVTSVVGRGAAEIRSHHLSYAPTQFSRIDTIASIIDRHPLPPRTARVLIILSRGCPMKARTTANLMFQAGIQD